MKKPKTNKKKKGKHFTKHPPLKTPPPPHTHTHDHTLQNKFKQPQYKLKQTQYKINPNEIVTI